MKFVILSLVYVALLNISNGARGPRNQPNPNQVVASILPSTFSPRSFIVIYKIGNGSGMPSDSVQGFLQRVPAHHSPEDANEPFGHAYVIIDEENYFYSRLGPSSTHDHNDNNNGTNDVGDWSDAADEVASYNCYIRRRPHRGLKARLRPVSGDHMHGIPYVHYVSSNGIDVFGKLTTLSFDDFAARFL